MVNFDPKSFKPKKKSDKKSDKRNGPTEYFPRKNNKRVYVDKLVDFSYEDLMELFEEVEGTLESMVKQKEDAEDWPREPEWFHPLKIKIKCTTSFKERLDKEIGSRGEGSSLATHFMAICREELQPSEYEFFKEEAERRQSGV